MSQWRRLQGALALLAAVLVAGTVGYVLLGFTLVDAIYQTVTTVATVGFREVNPLSTGGKFFTMALILLGVGATLYALTALIETLIEGRLLDVWENRRMQRNIGEMKDHVIICGSGRVGRSIAEEVAEAGRRIVMVDLDQHRLQESGHPFVVGDASLDTVLTSAGVERAAALVAAVDADADNSFIALSARALRSDLFIVARARSAESEQKLLRSGADRVVNPQHIGGARMAAFVLRPHVAEFLDVVMHEGNIEFHLEEITLDEDSPVVGHTLAQAHLRDRSGALVLALRDADGRFLSNPPPDTPFVAGHVLIAIGTDDELTTLAKLVRG